MSAVPSVLAAVRDPWSSGLVENATSSNAVDACDETSQPNPTSPIPALIAADRHLGALSTRPKTIPGVEQGEPREQRVSAVDEHAEHVIVYRSGVGIGEPFRTDPVAFSFVAPESYRRPSDRRCRADDDQPPAAPGEHRRSQHEHGAVVGEDRAAPDLVEQQAGDVQQQPATDEPQAHRPNQVTREGCLVGGRGTPGVDPSLGHQRDTESRNEDERRCEAGRQRTVPRVEQVLHPTGTAWSLAAKDEVSVVVHDHHPDHRDGSNDVGSRQPFGRAVDTVRWRRGAHCQTYSSTTVIVSGRWRSIRSPIAGTGSGWGTNAIEVRTWAVRAGRGGVAGSGTGCAPSASGVTPLAVPAPIMTRWPSITVSGGIRRALRRDRSHVEHVGVEMQKRFVAVPQAGAQPQAVRVCRAAWHTWRDRDG